MEHPEPLRAVTRLDPHSIHAAGQRFEWHLARLARHERRGLDKADCSQSIDERDPCIATHVEQALKVKFPELTRVVIHAEPM
jgi:hypothetical protein